MTTNNFIVTTIAIFLLGAITILQILVFHKTRRVHLATFKILHDTNRIHEETASLFTQTQALLALERKLGLAEALPPLRGWAGSPDFLLVVANEVHERKPLTTLECSSGASTVVIARCLQQIGQGHVFSLEHDPVFAEKTRRLLSKHELGDWATVLDAPLETRLTKTPWYSDDALPSDLPPIDLLVIDGPPQAVAHLARYPAVPRLMPRLSSAGVIIIDDANRDDEVETVKRWKAEFPQLRTFDYHCEKGCIRIENSN